MDNNILIVLIDILIALLLLLFIIRRKQTKSFNNKTGNHSINTMKNNTIHDEFLTSIFETIHQSIKYNKEEQSDIKTTYLRLINENVNEVDAIDGIASVIISEMYFSLKHKEYELFKERFLDNLRKLPITPKLI